ncbi:hypothetical protein ACC817_16255 [Rhizobium ruizarguesonis]
MPADINTLINLDFCRFRVCMGLSRTVLLDDPNLAKEWRDLHRAYMIERFPDREPDMTPSDLLGGSTDLLRSHPRYGFVVEWLDAWREASCTLRDAVCYECGITSLELDAVLNAELARRGDRDGREG